MTARKFKPGDRVRGIEEPGRAAYRGRIGTIEVFHKAGEYIVTFDDKPGVPEYVHSYWLEHGNMVPELR